MSDQTSLPDVKQSEAIPASPPIKVYRRFNLSQRLEHGVMLTSFSILALTGLPQKYLDSPISLAFIQLLGGIEAIRTIHHVAAVVLLAISIYHIVALLYRVIVLRTPWSMMPGIEDFIHLLQDIGYYLGLRQHKAYYGRYNYAEKAEYLAVVWGTLVMAITGFMMLNPIATTSYLPGQAIPAAKAAHGGEAVLAVLAIILWHFYHVHLKTFNKSMFTGKLTREEMVHEHPAELAQIETGKAWQAPAETVIRKRQNIFVPTAIVLTGVLGFGLFRFITLEQTAITTSPPIETVQVYLPVTPTPHPTPTPAPTRAPGSGVALASWDGSVSMLFRNRCSTCHGKTSVSGLSLETYQSALKGGDRGVAIVPGDPDNSILVSVQSTGNHPGQLSIDELNQVIVWINAGAPEK